jgi:hypothetical protein
MGAGPESAPLAAADPGYRPDSLTALSTSVAIAAPRGDQSRLEGRAELLKLYPEGLDAFAIKTWPFATPNPGGFASPKGRRGQRRAPSGAFRA